MNSTRTIATISALAAGLIGSAATASAQQATGVWIDHTGRGAVEITECGGGLCGHIVWLKDGKNKQVCRTQVIGNARPVSSGVWDRGWIVDPDDNARYTVELKVLGEDRLRVMGYMGSKMFSETMIWRRAPADLKRCDGQEAAKPASAPVAAVPAQAPEVARPAEVPPPPRTAAREPGYDIAPPNTDAPAPQQPPRQVTAPPQQMPSATTTPAAPQVAAPPPPPEASPRPRQPAYEDEPATTDRRSRKQASGKGKGGRDCSIDVPYLDITVKYRCDAF